MLSKDNVVSLLFWSIGVTLIGLTFIEIGSPIFAYDPNSLIAFVDSLENPEMSEYLLHFAFTLLFLSGVVLLPMSIVSVGYTVVWLIHRISLRYIYSKPRRVYPVKKQKFFSLY